MPEQVTKVWEGAEVLREHLVPMDALLDHERNARKGDVAALMGSLQRFGQVRPILVDGFTIVAGHHLRKAAIELGWTHIAVIPHEFPDEETRLAYLVADNFLSGLAGYDEQAQMTLVEELETKGQLEGTGIQPDHIEDMRAAFEMVPEAPAQSWTGGYAESEENAAARAEHLAQAQRMREIVLLVSLDAHEKFGEDIRKLMKHYGESGVVATVLRTISDAASVLE